MTAEQRSRTSRAKEALHERLLVAAPVLSRKIDVGISTSELLDRMARFVKSEGSDRLEWLLFIAITGMFPNARQLSQFHRSLSLSTGATAILAVLESTVNAASLPHAEFRRLHIVRDRVLVDVDFSATHEHNTGIQRVVRRTVPVWASTDRPFDLVAWTSDTSGLRALTEREEDRVLNWNDRQFAPNSDADAAASDSIETIIVPWDCQLFLAEVPSAAACTMLECVAASSGNRVSLLGYDAIPLVSAVGQRDEESERFAHYLTVVKHSAAVVAISESAAEEFRGFSDMLVAQGLSGPTVSSVSLAVEVPAAARVTGTGGVRERPLVLCVGSHEPRKNQEAVLFAAEQLFREGIDFELVFVGAGNAAVLHNFDKRIKRLNRQGAHISSFRTLGDGRLWELYAEARFSVFVSLHEGFGLPVAESVAFGTPVLTSNFGSLAEIARAGGCLMVDPRDDIAVVQGFRRMLTDDGLMECLGQEAAAMVPKTWREYADELWTVAIESGGTGS